MASAIEVLPIGSVAVAVRTWKHRGRRLLTAIVKATYTIVHDGMMVPTAPSPIAATEKHLRGNPVASLVRASDLALLVPKPEVVVVGSAFAGPGQRVQSTSVRLAVQRGTTMLLNKRLDVLGSRRVRPGAAPPDPEPFDVMPLSYERALGGIASRDNPVGVGMDADADGLLTLPNVSLPLGQPSQGPAGFGPIPSAWPARQKLRGSLSWSDANQSLDVEVPDDFDDAYFQTAPADQRVADLRAGDLFALVNMHPEHGTLRTFLPATQGVALAQTAQGERLPFQLRIDTVHLEPDAMRAEIVYRGAMVLSDTQLVRLRLAGALASPDAPAAFPDLATVSGLVSHPLANTPAPRDASTTAVIEVETPPAAHRPPARAEHPLARGGTVVMEPERPALATAPVLAGAAAPDAKVTDRRATGPGDRRSSTMLIEAEAPPQSLPFAKRSRRKPGADRPAVADSRAGTPWAHTPDEGGTPPAAMRPHVLSATLDIAPPDVLIPEGHAMADEPTVEAPIEEKPPTPPPAPPAPHAPAPPAPRADPYANRPPEPAAPPPARAPEPVKRANFKADIYKKLKR